MKRALYPGTFDPVTKGHLDIIERTTHLFDEIVVAVSDHGRKKTLFDVQKRCALLKESLIHLPQVTVESFTSLSVNFAREHECHALIRGLRVTSDFEYEFTMARFFSEQDPDMEVVYLMANGDKLHISSTMVKEIASLGGDVSSYVPHHVKKAMKEKYFEKSSAA